MVEKNTTVEKNTAETTTTERTSSQPARSRSPIGFVKLALFLVVALAAILWLAHWFYYQHTHVSADDANVVTHEVTVSSRLPGRLTHFSLIEGDSLSKNDVVASLYRQPDQLRLEALKAKVAGMQAKVAYEQQRIQLSSDQLQGGIQETRDELQADESAMKAAKAVMDSAQKTYKRSKDLVRSGAVSAQKRDEDYYNYLSALADYERAKRQVTIDHTALANAQTGLMSSPQMVLPNPDLLRAQLQVTRQALAQAKADLQQQQVHLNDMTVRSPLDGVVDKTFVEPGEYVSPGQPILMMHAPSDVWVEARIKETKVGELKVGQPVEIHVDAHPDTHYSGHIQVIGHAATSQFALLPDPNPSGNFTKITQRIPVRIAIDHGIKATLSPGMMVEVDVDIRGDADQGSARP